MAFAQLTFRESRRDIVTCLRAMESKLYHAGFRSPISRSTLADANRGHDWRIYADFAQVLIQRARRLYASDPLSVELQQTVYALDSTTIDLCLSLFPWAHWGAMSFAAQAIAEQGATKKQIEAVAEAGRAVRRVRAENLPKIKGGLRALYRTLELPGANPLKDAHAELDAAVLAAYGFSPQKDLLAQLLELNLDVARRIDAGEKVLAPGIPPDYPEPKKLVSDDCIQPRKMGLFGE